MEKEAKFVSRKDDVIFVFRPQSAQAFGRCSGGRKFTVLAGSTVMRHGSANEKRERGVRDGLLRDGILEPDRNSSLYRFTQDYEFSSPSCAAGVVKDGNASGPGLWKHEETGLTLREYRASLKSVP